MKTLLAPLSDLIASLYDFLIDAADKVLSLAKPVITVGLLIDVVTGKLGWIDHILDLYNKTLSHTSSASMIVVIIVGLILLGYLTKK
jgi:flagellar biosynthesis protein FliR